MRFVYSVHARSSGFMTAEEMATARQALEAVECADEVAGRVHDSLNR